MGECMWHGTTVDPRWGCSECAKERRYESDSNDTKWLGDMKWKAHERLQELCQKDNNTEKTKSK